MVAYGATTFTTVDSVGETASLQITADGSVDIDSAAGTSITLDSGGAINLEPEGGSAILLDGTISVDAGVVTGVTSLQVDYINANASTLTITDSSDTGDKLEIAVSTHGATTITTTDDDAAAANIQITADGTAELAGTTVTLDSAGDIELEATNDVNIPSGVGLTFATTEKIESNGTDLSITVGAGGDINIPADIGVTFGSDGNKSEERKQWNQINTN